MQLAVDQLAGPFAVLAGGADTTGGFTLITVTLDSLGPDLQNIDGQVTITLTETMENGGAIIPAGSIVACYTAGALTTRGGGPVQIAATDNVGTTPRTAMYVFAVDMDGAMLQTVESTVSWSLRDQTFDLGTLL